MTDTTRIDAVLAGLPADQRAALERLRGKIAEVAPGAVEAMSDTSKGTIRFTPDKPLPAELVEKLVRARMADSDERRGGKP